MINSIDVLNSIVLSNFRVVNYIFNILYNIALFYIIFHFGDSHSIILFNKVDLLVAILPLFLTLGVERILPFQRLDIAHGIIVFKDVFNFIFVITGVFLLFFINNNLIFISFLLGFQYAYVNIVNAYMNCYENLSRRFLIETVARLLLLSGLFSYLLLFEGVLSIKIIKFFFLLSFVLIISFNFKNINFISINFKNLIKEYFGYSKYVFILIILGTAYGNIPRIYEIIFGTELYSVKFYFWLKLLAYLSALGMFYSYIITRKIVRDGGLKNTNKFTLLMIVFFGFSILLFLLVNKYSHLTIIAFNRLDGYTLLLLSLTGYLMFIKELITENILSINLDYKQKMQMFFKVIGVFMFLNLLFALFVSLSVFIVLINLFLSSLYWLVIGFHAIKDHEDNIPFFKKIFFILIIVSFSCFLIVHEF